MAPLSGGRFTVPSRGEVVPRRRLTERLGGPRGHVWIAAPAGSGKTTLAAELVAGARAPAAWCRLDALDADPGTFFGHLAGALRTLGAPRAPRLGPELQATPVAFARHLGAVLGPRLPAGFLLVVDDYHLLPQGSALHEAFAAFVAELPPGSRIIVASRSAIPPAWARLEVEPGVARVGPEDLAFDANELRAVARLLGVTPTPDAARRVLERTHGWAAGLVLLLRGTPAQQEAALVHPEGIFRFFANELLAHAPEVHRRFLEQVAVLPHLTAATAARVSGRRDAGQLLTQFHHEHVFLERHRRWRHTWVFHPLFRDFLLERLRAACDEAELQRLRAAGAAALEGDDDEAAVELWLEAGLPNRALELITRHAARWVEQARWSMLLDWFARLPPAALEGSPRARLWRGTCLLYRDTAAARADFSSAFRALGAARDWEGMHLAWCGAVQSVLFEFGDFAQLDEWIDAHANFGQGDVPRASLATRLRQKVLLFAALMVRRPLDPAVPALEKTLHRLVFYAPLQPAQRLQVGANLLRFHAWRGDLEQSRLVVDRLRRAASQVALDPLSALLWRVVEAMFSWYGLSPEAGQEAAERGLTAARESGVHLMDFTFLVQAAYAAFSHGDEARAREVIGRMPATLGDERVVHFGHYQFFCAWLDFAAGEPRRALERLEPCHALAVRTGSPYVLVQLDYGYAQALYRCGRRAEAEAINDAALAQASGCGYGPQQYLLLLNRASFAAAEKDLPRLDRTLAEAFALGRARGYGLVPFWTHEDLAPLLARALDQGLEPAFAQEVIRSQRVRPGGAAETALAWPRRVVVRALGDFEVTVGGERLAFGGKVQHRPLELLKLLLVERRVRVGDAATALWPESDAASGQDNLKTTLARLRKLIGAEAVCLEEGALALDRGEVGCDLWAVEQALADEEAGRDALARVRALHRGALLPGDDHLPWALEASTRLRRRVLSALQRAAQRRLPDDARDAVALAEAALAVDPLAEPSYRVLIQGFLALGQAPDAQRAYLRCERSLSEHLGIAPSPETRALLAAIRPASRQGDVR